MESANRIHPCVALGLLLAGAPATGLAGDACARGSGACGPSAPDAVLLQRSARSARKRGDRAEGDRAKDEWMGRVIDKFIDFPVDRTALPFVGHDAFVENLCPDVRAGPNLNARPPAGSGPEGALLASLDRLVTKLGLTFYYDIDEPIYIFDHLMPLVRVLPGKFVRLGDADLFRSCERLKEAKALGFPGEALDLECGELGRLLSNMSNYWVSLKGKEDDGCGPGDWGPSVIQEQTVRLWHGIDCVDPDLVYSPEANSSLIQLQLNRSVFRGRGARNYLTQYPPVAFSRAFAGVGDSKFELARWGVTSKNSTKPVVVWALAERDQTTPYLPVLERLAENYTVVLVSHPVDGPFDLGSGSKIVQLPSWRVRKFNWQELAHAADVFVTDENWGSSVTTFALAFDKPLIVANSKKFEEKLRNNLKKGDFLDDDNAVILSGPEADVGDLLQRALKGDAEKLPKRQRLFRDIVGCVDGYEEYRVAFQILRKSFSADGVSAEALLEPLYQAYDKLPTPPSVSGVHYSEALCDPRAG